MNKSFMLAVAVFVAFPLFAATHEGEGKEKLTTQTDKLSVRLLLDDWRSGFAQKEFEPGMERMKNEMLRDPQHNLSPIEAKKHAESWFRDELRVRYSAEVEKILRPFATSLSSDEIEKFRAGENTFFEQRFRNLFEKGFARVRKELVEEQRKQVFRRIYPTAAELETMNDQQLAKMLVERFHKGLNVPLWAENAPLVQREVVEPAIRAGREQQSLQLTLLQRETVPASLWEAQVVKDHLTKELNRVLAERIPDSAERYALFPKTEKQLNIKAERMAFDRVIAAMPRQLPVDRYMQLLEKEPAKHRQFNESVKMISSVFQQYLIQEALQQTGAPKGLSPKLENDSEVKKAAERRFNELTGQLKNTRKEFAGKQLEQYWPVLAKGEWIPEMQETELYEESGTKVIPELKTRPKSDKLIRETEEKTEQLIREALSKEVRRLEVQRKRVGVVYDKVLNAMEKRQESLSGEKSWFENLFSSENITLNDVVKMYRKEVIAKSSEPLFPSIEKEIEVRSRAILQRVLNQSSKKSGGDSDLMEVTFTLELSGSGDRLTLAIDKWKYTFHTQKFSVTGVEKEIRSRMAQSKGLANYKISLIVKGSRIYYSDVAKIRDALKNAFFECDFEDSLEK